ncbi:mitochondrial ribosomal subunit S27-domain-containing protein [Microdochium trichocladiopsis]|uniref:Small ribosomal subunit protein mS33 n=1 Tax=Microdochium trichocladiopsis TaxID=1682393 RepID=A0A9P9BI05_9PEZI|nr:mitochondrial ribosomal subunit S27-domain-containing protein [Microdochium trichocladiopsis]KAH7021085.1 mitochondrial ribosomal subunit S27-domain-containing protein [Microdochium trichocladiopsis]
MATVPKARLLSLMKTQCEIFSTTFNPEQIRAGNKILRQRLKGPSLVKYYPPRLPDLKTLARDFESFGLEVVDEAAMDREEHLAGVRARGKGAPKKKRTAKVEKGPKR